MEPTETTFSLPEGVLVEPRPAGRPHTLVLALANQKGGVGKTTTAINLGAALVAFDRRVLLVDCDPQGNASRGLGLVVDAPHLYHVLMEAVPPAAAIRKTGFRNFEILPSDRQLVGVEVEFVGVQGWELRLRNAIDRVRGDYDFVLLDCPPSLGHLTVSALTAADRILVPLQSEYFALEGISELVATVRRVQGRMNPALDIGGVVLTMHDERMNLARDVAAEVQTHFPDQVFRTVIPRNVRLAEAPSHGLPILQYDIKSRGALAYLAVARELLERTQ